MLGRVLDYARPYWLSLALMLAAIGVTALIGLVPPLLYRDLIDNVLPGRDLARLNLLALAMIGIPVISGLIGVAQRYLSARVGEGIICDLRQADVRPPAAHVAALLHPHQVGRDHLALQQRRGRRAERRHRHPARHRRPTASPWSPPWP